MANLLDIYAVSQVQEHGNRLPYVKNVFDLGRMVMERIYRPHWFIDAVYYRTQQGKEFQQMCEFSHEYASEVIRKRQEKVKRGENPAECKR